MTMSKPGWGAVVQGQLTDLKEWANALREDFDPWVEIYQGETILRSERLDELTSAGEVYDHAPDLIELLNGIMTVAQSTLHPILFTGKVVRFAPDGTTNRILMVGSAQLKLQGESVLAIQDNLATVVRPNGKLRSPPPPLPSPPPQPSNVQHWFKLVERDPSLRDALVYFGKGANWPDIYKALERLYQRAGGWHAFLALNWESEEEVKRLKFTAYWELKSLRHAKLEGKPPKRPMRPEDAHALLGRLLRRALG